MAFSSSFVSSFEFLWSSYKKRLNIKWLLLSKSKINNLAGFLLYRWLLLPILSSTDSIYTYINYNCSCKPDRISCTCLISVLGLNFWICLEFQWKTEKKLKFSTFCWNSSSFLRATKATLSQLSYLVLWQLGPRSHLLSASCWLLDQELQLSC